jgi:hypothetical protein
VTQAKAETTQANARIGSLSAYGNFVQIKNARVQAVKDLAEGRFDWEMVMRELARVLPADVWLLSADASTAAADSATNGAASTGSGNTPSTSTTTTTGGDSTGTVDLAACAKSQQGVAVALVRLRQMNGASDVALKQSTVTKAEGAASGDSGGGSDGSCGPGQYQFQASITLAKQDGGSSKVPASLGGGS